jgi:hypothetical protein
MFLIVVARKTTIILCVSLVILFLSLCLVARPFVRQKAISIMQAGEWEKIINEFFSIRNDCVLHEDFDRLSEIYLTSEKNGRWAYENELIRSRYLRSWANKQGVDFTGIESTVVIKRIKEVGRGYAFYILASNEYTYVYRNDPATVNRFRLGTYHSLDLIPASEGNGWIISREWYDDPLSNYLDPDTIPEEITETITSHTARDLSDLSEARIAAVEYADKYCGAASDGQNGYTFNTRYTDYNPLGGDCANFASQIYHEGGGLAKTTAWNFKNGKGSRSWVNAQGFRDFMVYSGRASVIATGRYAEVYKSAYELLPGDFIAYIKKGKVVHISVVTGHDSKGYPLVNSHNSDRFRVPWDIGWSKDGVRFCLVRVHF